MKIAAVVPVRLLLLLTTTVSVGDAFPFAAGACPGGVPAVAGTTHTNTGQGKKQTTGSLSDGNLGVLLNGVALSEEQPASINVGQVHALELRGDGTFKGFLVRLGPPTSQLVDLRESLSPLNETAQIATVTCVDVEQVGGLTHTDNTVKTSTSGSLLVTVPVQGLLMDVTVVVQQNSSISTFYYSNFVLHAIQEGDEGKDATESPTLLDEPPATINNNTNNTTTSNNETQIDVETNPTDDTLNTGGTVVVAATSGGTSGSTTCCRNGVQNNFISTLLLVVVTLAGTTLIL
jgi:hypothetical protein